MLLSVLLELPNFKEALNKQLTDQIDSFLNVTPSDLTLPFLSKLTLFSHDCFVHVCNQKVYAARSKWKEFVKKEMGAGGSSF